MTQREKQINRLLDSAIYRASMNSWNTYLIEMRDRHHGDHVVEVWAKSRDSAMWRLNGKKVMRSTIERFILDNELKELQRGGVLDDTDNH